MTWLSDLAHRWADGIPLLVVGAVGLVVGAEWTATVQSIRRLVSEMPMLSPWVGVLLTGGLAVYATWRSHQTPQLPSMAAPVAATTEHLGEVADEIEALLEHGQIIEETIGSDVEKLRELLSLHRLLRDMDLLFVTTDGEVITAANPALIAFLEEDPTGLHVTDEYLPAFTTAARVASTAAYHDRTASQGAPQTRFVLPLGPRDEPHDYGEAGDDETTAEMPRRTMVTWYSYGDSELGRTYGIGVPHTHD